MNLGAIMIFARRAAQISAYLMLALNTIDLAGIGLMPLHPQTQILRAPRTTP